MSYRKIIGINIENGDVILSYEKPLCSWKDAAESRVPESYMTTKEINIYRMLDEIDKLQKENEKLKQEIKDITSIPEGDESYE